MRVGPRGWDATVFAIIDGDVPSPSDFDEIRKRRLPVQIVRMPQGYSALDFLEPIVDTVEVLIVADYSCEDARLVGQMINLRELSLSIDSRFAVDFSGLLQLSLFSGPWKTMESIAKCRELNALYLDAPNPSGLVKVDSSLTTLDLSSARHISSVPVIPASSELSALEIQGAKTLDLAPIDFYQNLRRLRLESCRAIAGASTLLKLNHLEALTLENCQEIDDWEDLEGLTVQEVRIVGRNPFDADFRSRVAPSQRWTFPHGLLPVPRGNSSSRSEYLLHPALDKPLRVPSDSLGEISGEDIPLWWQELAREAQRERFLLLWGRILQWASDNGGQRVVHTLSTAEGVAEKTEELGRLEIAGLVRDPFTLNYLRIESGHEVLVKVGDSVEDGISVFASNSSKLPKMTSLP